MVAVDVALQLGVLPNVSPRRLATIYQPLRDVLEARLQLGHVRRDPHEGGKVAAR